MSKIKNPRLSAAIREVHRNIPRTVKKARLKGENRRKMLIAIALSKFRRS